MLLCLKFGGLFSFVALLLAWYLGELAFYCTLRNCLVFHFMWGRKRGCLLHSFLKIGIPDCRFLISLEHQKKAQYFFLQSVSCTNVIYMPIDPPALSTSIIHPTTIPTIPLLHSTHHHTPNLPLHRLPRLHNPPIRAHKQTLSRLQRLNILKIPPLTQLPQPLGT